MESITRFIERKLRLKVNKAKSKVAPSRECKFLGYMIGGKGQLRISKESKAKMTDKLKALTASPQAAEAMCNKWFAEMGLIPLVSPAGGNRVVP